MVRVSLERDVCNDLLDHVIACLREVANSFDGGVGMTVDVAGDQFSLFGYCLSP